jgi:hypothetical protein
MSACVVVAVIAGVMVANSGSSGDDVASEASPVEKPKEAEHPVAAPDLSKVEPVEVIRQAVAFSRTVHPKSVLIGARFKSLRHGLLDLKGDSVADVEFEYRTVDSSKAPGEDVVAGSFRVTTQQGAFKVWAHSTTPHSAHNLTSTWSSAFPPNLPECAAMDAFAVAVKSGVPATATTDLFWDKVHTFSGDKKMQWSFRVAGHDGLRREISADQGCELLRSWEGR